MFCLRSWLNILIFLSNASPCFILLYLSGTYILHRPCVYCSILLFVLVFSLFDFQADWFEPRWQPSSRITEVGGSLLSGNAAVTELLSETASLAISAINGTGGSFASMAMDSIKRKATGKAGGELITGVNENGFEVLRNVLEKRHFRIPCVGVNVRL